MADKFFEAAIRCTVPACSCECFAPGKSQLRVCETCKHGWVSHALDKLGYRQNFQLGMQVELVQPNIVFDIASLILYGSQATPIRLKILLDRLFSVLQHDEVIQVLHGFGWTYEDYARGYILQEPAGRVLDKWSITTREEEHVIIQQFLRFGETKSIAKEIILHDSKNPDPIPKSVASPKSESEIKKFMERTGSIGLQNYLKVPDSRQILGARFGMYPFTGSRMMSPIFPAQGLSPCIREGSPSPMTSPKNAATALEDASVSPMDRLQNMQPQNYKTSPSTSPLSISIASSQSSDTESNVPQNLSVSATKQAHKVTPDHLVVQSGMATANPQPENLSTRSRQPSPAKTPDSAINYSMKMDVKLDEESHDYDRVSLYADRKIKHLRKSNNPIKRQWQPSPAFGGTFISPSGKKRVLCTACNKTFCDKGALKIHYSAVHLKEMHKCTVDGCSMMFSSRRSRNRHSANPNPKLHMPQKRKTPDGSRIVDDGTGKPGIPPLTSMTTSMSLSPSSSAMHHEMARYIPSVFLPGERSEQAYFVDSNNRLTLMPSLMDDADESSSAKNLVISSQPESPEEDQPVSFSGQQASSRSSSKRKRMVPTRCTQQSDENSFNMSDDEMDDTDGLKVKRIAQQYSTSYPMDLATKSSRNPGSQQVFQPPQLLQRYQIKQEAVDDSESYSEPLDLAADKHAFLGVQKRTMKSMSFMRPTAESTTGNHSDVEEVRHDADVTFVQNEDRPPSSAPITSLTPTSETSTADSRDELPFTACTEDMYKLNSGAVSNNNDSSNEFDGDFSDDVESSKKCAICGTVFQNNYSLKTHYHNVHFAMMHSCTIDGCNAAFPSKVSRDRHSANGNLHRKLVSTCEEDGNTVAPTSTGGYSSAEESYNQPYDLSNGKPEFSDTVYDLMNGKTPYTQAENEADSPGNGSEGQYTSHNGLDIDDADSDEAMSDGDTRVDCHICTQKFRDNLVLKEHMETYHPREMYRCTVKGCDKLFSTRKSRNRHSQNENLHRNPGLTA